MAQRLRGEEIVTIRVLAEKGQNNCRIAETMGITEGPVPEGGRRGQVGPVTTSRPICLRTASTRVSSIHRRRKTSAVSSPESYAGCPPTITPLPSRNHSTASHADAHNPNRTQPTPNRTLVRWVETMEAAARRGTSRTEEEDEAGGGNNETACRGTETSGR